MHVGTSGSSGKFALSTVGILPVFRRLFTFEFANTLASWTEPGHLIFTSMKIYA